jgi:hypothetical protein
MWISSRVFDLFTINKQSFDSLNQEIATLRIERDLLKSELLTTKANFDWLRIRSNALEAERAQLLEKAYNIRIPVPEIVRTPTRPLEMNQDLFNDMGDSEAKIHGLPTFDS